METIELNIPYFNFSVVPLCGEKVNEILEKVNTGVIHFSKIDNEELTSAIIQKDAYLFNYKSPFENMDDFDGSIQDESNLHSLENIHTLKKENDNYFAGRNGLLVQYDGIIKFIPVTNNGACEVLISENKTIATAKFYPASKNGIKLTENNVIQILKKKGISVNLEMLEINSALDYVNMSNEVIDDVLVASGKKPKLGTEAWTEYLFDTKPKSGPVITEDGNTDYHNLNLIESVSKNQKVAIFHPMVEGEAGHNLFGEKIIPPKVKEGKPPRGQNVYYAEKEPNYLLSKIDGHITYVRGEIIVTNLYNIRGDVDFNTGNIICKGSLNITGNVKTGFNLDMSQTVTIGGYLNDSKLVAGGDVIIRGGFKGTGEGIITSDGNVTIRYIRDQTVYSRGDIAVEKEVVEAKLFAKGDIKSISNKLVIVGGHSIAGGDVDIHTLGNEYSMETIIEAGYDYEVIEKIKENDELRKTIKMDLKVYKEQIDNGIANGVVSKLAKALLIKSQMMKKELEVLQEKRNVLKESISNSSKSKVIVSNKIYPGVKIVIGGYKFEVNEIMRSKKFSVSTKEEGIIVSNR